MSLGWSGDELEILGIRTPFSCGKAKQAIRGGKRKEKGRGEHMQATTDSKSVLLGTHHISSSPPFPLNLSHRRQHFVASFDGGLFLSFPLPFVLWGIKTPRPPFEFVFF